MGVIHQKSGDLESAKEYHDHALAIRLKKLDPDHTDVATTYSHLGDIHQQLGDLAQAKEYQDRALAIRLKKLGPDHTGVATTCCELDDLKREKEYQDVALATRKGKLSDHTAVNTQFRNRAFAQGWRKKCIIT